MIEVSRDTELDEATRAALSSGRAHPAMAMFIDTLMQLRGITEAEGDVLAGATLEGEAPAAMSPHALDLALAAIDRGGPLPLKRTLAYPELDRLPPSLLDAMRGAEAARGWKVYGPGIRRLALGTEAGLKLEVIRLDAGRSVPRHTHKGRELTLCIHGEYADGLATYGPGDFSVTDRTTRHQPKASDKAPAYALVVTDAGLRFEGLLGFLQKLAGQAG